jgi:ribosomal subunit interface protein
MTISISGTNLTITDAMQSQIKKSLTKLNKILPHNKVEVSVKKEKQGFIVHAEYSTDKGVKRGTDTNRDFYKAMKSSVDKIERQIVTIKQGFNKKGNKPTQINMADTDINSYDNEDLAFAS